MIICYYWPPAGGPGVQRWLKFVKYLPDFDIEPIVYVPENPTYPLLDFDLTKEVSPSVRVIKKPIIEPYAWASFFSKKATKISSGIIPKVQKQSVITRFLLWVRGNFFIPDARVLWVKPSVKNLEKIIIDEQIDTIITSGPPHSMHLIGLGLKNKLGNKLHWFADFRDPWTTIGYHKELKLSNWAAKKHKKLEQKVLQTANHILVTSPTTKKEFLAIANKPISVLTNGFDVLDEVQTDAELSSYFTISHIGSLLSNRNPLVLWEVLSELIEENIAFNTHFKLELTGAVSEDVLSSITNFGLNPFLKLNGYVSHTKALELQKTAQVLLLIEIDSEETKCIIPGKLFEYMLAARPILALGPKNADIQNIILETESGCYFTYTNKESLKNQILAYFMAFHNQELYLPTDRNILQYSRKAITEELAVLLKKNTPLNK